MQKATIITEELIRQAAPNAAAAANGKKISEKGGFVKLRISEDETLIFGECKGSGSKPYFTSADFIGDAPVYRCSCPSRQFPCKHALAIMFDYLAGKKFETAEIPEDILRKRGKLADKAEKAASAEKTPKKTNAAAAAKKLKKQREGLELADSFVKDILSQGAASVNKASLDRYAGLAKQLGDYYLPGIQKHIYAITAAAAACADSPDDRLMRELIHGCVRLSAALKKSRAYIDEKLESGQFLPEDSVLYEEMGGIWKLTQLEELGLFRANEELLQLYFTVLDNKTAKQLTDTGYWISLSGGDILKTENIRPYKALKHIKEEDSAFGVRCLPKLCIYPGGLNRRVRWEGGTVRDVTAEDFAKVISAAEPTVADAVKKAKNELKNTLSDPYAVLLLPFDSFAEDDDGRPVLIHGEERVRLTECADFPGTTETLALLAGGLTDGALLSALAYAPESRRINISPIAAVTVDGTARL